MTTPPAAPRASDTKQDPFAWQDKRILRRIREKVEDYASALAVYCSLTAIASDSEAEEFQTTHAWLSQLSGFGERTVRSRLQDLQAIKAVEVITPKLRAPSTYRLLPFGNGCRTSGNGCRAFGKGKAPSVADIRSYEVKKGSPKPLGIAESISREKKLGVLKSKLKDLEQDTADLWQRESYPDKVKQRDDLRAQVAGVERELTA